ncbi:Conserved hypothetical protein CHP00255 [Syntrophobotulus glycolicus DSM 8271]|uniref:YicC-like domain-containing protein n=1 Tax=Syntrophobotulus glycolicus (strain DSM 8271 / FlGlyR) TaxID=645991 RepID=F0T0I7_SYNGF|nr:YicC/YloC family endoribonuclease [Syntrophobotulus glycolicus]ADY55052.1 Conserved hypothetical protein CHP00255 [Syntrophobotulus glycolicus DSM 8271]
MPESMTGFGRGKSEGAGYRFEVEMKAVNHRYLEIVIRNPRSFSFAEDPIKKIIREKVSRSRIEVYVNVKQTEEKLRLVKVDKDLALSYDKSLKELAEVLQAEYISDIYRLASLPEVLATDEEETDGKAVWPVLEAAVREALTELLEMRKREGDKLVRDLVEKTGGMRGIAAEIAARAPQVVEEYRQKLKDRIAALLGDVTVDETRLATEVALFADRASIEEELVRLNSHFDQFEHALRLAEPVGRKLDFLIQEMNREINTIGSKANDFLISRAVVNGKSELEKIREQVQNIE